MPTTRLLNCKLKHLGSQANAVGPRVIQACREQRVHSLDTEGTRPGAKGIQACRRCRHTHASETGAYGTTRKFQTHPKNEKKRENALLCESAFRRLATSPEGLRVGVIPSRNVSGYLASRCYAISQTSWMRVGVTPTRKHSRDIARRRNTDSHYLRIFPCFEPCGTIC